MGGVTPLSVRTGAPHPQLWAVETRGRFPGPRTFSLQFVIIALYQVAFFLSPTSPVTKSLNPGEDWGGRGAFSGGGERVWGGGEGRVVWSHS